MHRLMLVTALLAATSAGATLAPGVKAPQFATKGASAGVEVNVTLAQLLRKGPVVLYFFPAANTGGCNAEAHAFAEAIPDFTAAGATVVGMSADTVETLKAFSNKECAGKFTVARAEPATVKNYDVDYGTLVSINGSEKRQITTRTSYVVVPGGKIIYEYTGGSPLPHIANTLKAVRDWRAAPR